MYNFLKLLLPDHCLSCRVEVESYGLCPDCFRQIKFITANSCQICGHPFAFRDSFEKICGKCLIDPPLFDKNISALEFDKIARNLIVNFKYHDQQIYNKYFVNIMRQRAKELIDECDFICSVPMHWFKILTRNFNQSYS